MADEAFKTKNVVLVHGAFADGSSWSGIVERLQEAGLHLTAVQNPLTSLTADVRATRRVLAMQDGPTAKRMNAHTVEVDASHASPVSQPSAIADLIKLAAR